MLQMVHANIVIGVAQVEPREEGVLYIPRMMVYHPGWEAHKVAREIPFDLFDDQAKTYIYKGCWIATYAKGFTRDKHTGTVIFEDVAVHYTEKMEAA